MGYNYITNIIGLSSFI